MKRNELKMLIRQTAERERPEVLGKIHLNAIEIAPETVRKPRLTFRFGTILGFAALLLVVGITSIFVYQSLNPPVSVDLALDSETEVYGFQMVSAASLLEAVEPLSLSLVPLSMESDTPLISDQIEDLTTYLNIMETMLGDQESISFTAETSDRAEYQTMVVYDSTDLLGNAISYQLYYNEIPDALDSDQTNIEGLMVISGRELVLAGTVTENADGIKTRFMAMINAENYVSVEDKSTADRQKFEYQVVEAGVLVQKNEISLVLEEEEITAVIEYETETTQVQYRFRKTVGDSTGSTIRVQYSCTDEEGQLEDGEIDVSVEYDEASASYRYNFQVDTQHGSHSGNHQYSGDRTVKMSEDDDEPGNSDHPGNGNEDDEPSGNDNVTTTGPGNDDDEPGNDEITTTEPGNDETSGSGSSEDHGTEEEGPRTGTTDNGHPRHSTDSEPAPVIPSSPDSLLNA